MTPVRRHNDNNFQLNETNKHINNAPTCRITQYLTMYTQFFLSHITHTHASTHTLTQARTHADTRTHTVQFRRLH